MYGKYKPSTEFSTWLSGLSSTFSVQLLLCCACLYLGISFIHVLTFLVVKTRQSIPEPPIVSQPSPEEIDGFSSSEDPTKSLCGWTRNSDMAVFLWADRWVGWLAEVHKPYFSVRGHSTQLNGTKNYYLSRLVE